MLQIVPQMRIFLAHQPLDFRKGIDGLVGHCRQQLSCDPYSGALFVFTNRRRTGIRILAYDGQGFWLCYKRWSSGRLTWWPNRETEKLSRLDARQLLTVLWNGDPDRADFAESWRPLDSEL
jgi:transposase